MLQLIISFMCSSIEFLNFIKINTLKVTDHFELLWFHQLIRLYLYLFLQFFILSKLFVSCWNLDKQRLSVVKALTSDAFVYRTIQFIGTTKLTNFRVDIYNLNVFKQHRVFYFYFRFCFSMDLSSNGLDISLKFQVQIDNISSNKITLKIWN